jgi:hypothetical protein
MTNTLFSVDLAKDLIFFLDFLCLFLYFFLDFIPNNSYWIYCYL